MDSQTVTETNTHAVPTSPTARGCPNSRPILVVEDDPDIRESLQAVLEGEGYCVCTAENGRQASDELSHERPCVVLLDLMMPVMDGWELLAKMNKDAKLSSIPVVIVSAQPDREASAHAVRTLRKPFSLDDLLGTVRDLCG